MEMVRIRVLDTLDNFCNNDSGKSARNLFNLLYTIHLKSY